MTYLYAQLVERGVPIHRIRDLTDRHIYDICFYPRSDKGHLEPPAREMPDWAAGLSDREADYLCLFEMGRQAGVPEEVLQQEWQKKYGPNDRPWEG